MRVILLISALFLFGCGTSNKQTPAPVVLHPCILDEALQRPEFANAIKQAQRDLPGDKWQEKPWRMNVSREKRERDVAMNILATVEPKFRHMTVTELVNALKVGPLGFGYDGVADEVYEFGNMDIIKELKSRPKDELRVLPSFANDKLEVYSGPQGPGDTLYTLIHYEILHDR